MSVKVRKSFVHAGKAYEVGEIWYDHAGNECFYRENGTISCRTVNNEPSMTDQSHRDSCDFNKIYERFVKSGRTMMTNLRKDPPMYGDFSNMGDYHDTVFRVQQAEESFMRLPAQLRARFSNDPGELLDFLSKEENRAEAISLGLVAAPQDSQIPQGVKPTPPSAEGTPPSGEGG